jgi:hypothetical protein
MYRSYNSRRKNSYRYIHFSTIGAGSQVISDLSEAPNFY